jgi:hypothetical protein
MEWIAELSKPRRYDRQFDRLHAKYFARRRLHTLTQGGVTFAELFFEKRSLASMLAREVKAGTYTFSAARVREVMLDRPRNLFYLEALDFIVAGVVAELLTEAIEPLLSPSLYSYRQGLSSWQAVRRFARWTRDHRAAHPDPKTRGVYVFRADVQGYADSIALGARSRLWPMLRDALGTAPTGAHWGILEKMVRPEILHDDGSRSVRCRGLPLGSPVTTPLLNLYLHELDRKLDGLNGGFYARFGDDLLFAHADPAAAKMAIGIIHEFLEKHDLQLHAEKQRLLFFNGAGHPSVAWPETRGTRAVAFLGCEIRFDGTVALPRDKWRIVLNDLAARIGRMKRLLRGAPLAECGAALCSVVNESLDPRSLFANRHAMRLRSLVTSREQLAELDYLVARMIVEAVTGRRGVRAFREISRRRLYEEWKLASMVALRNDPYSETRRDGRSRRQT